MSNNLAINITAADNFSVTFADLDKKAGAVGDTLGKGRRQQKDWADSFNRSLQGVSRGAQDLADSVGLARGPLGALFSIGAAGGIAAGAMAAAVGVGMLTKSWSESGQEIDRTSHILGVSAQGLQTWREAARLAGGTAEGMTATIAQLGLTLQDSMYGRNPQAAMLMRTFGIAIARDARGQVDTLRTMNNVFNAMNQIQDPLAKRKFAQTLGIPEETTYTARRAGSFMAQVRGSGVVMGPDKIAEAVQTERGLTALGQSSRAVGNQVGGSELNPLGNLSRRLAERAEANARESVSPPPTQEEVDSLKGRFLRQNDPRGRAQPAPPAASAGGEVTVNVTVPEGARVTATSNGPPLRVQRTGPVN